LEACTMFLVQLSLLLMYNPKRTFFNSSFPFHATTTAMLHGRAGTKGTLEGSNTFDDAHLRRAAEIARKIKMSVRTIQEFSGDLTCFLDEIDPASDELDYKDEILLDANLNSRRPSNIKPNYKPQNVVP